jgi:hypothetical protein
MARSAESSRGRCRLRDFGFAAGDGGGGGAALGKAVPSVLDTCDVRSHWNRPERE